MVEMPTPAVLLSVLAAEPWDMALVLVEDVLRRRSRNRNMIR